MTNEHAATRPLVAGLAGSALVLAGLTPVGGAATPAGGATPRAEAGTLAQAKVDARVGAKVLPRPIYARRTDTRVKVRVFAPVRVRGHAVVHYRGFWETARVRRGMFVMDLGHWPSAGRKKVTITYLGSHRVERARKVVKFRVRPR